MASRVAEVIYKLKDLFTGPAKRVERGYDRIKRSARDAADSVERQNSRMSKSFGVLVGSLKRVAGPLLVIAGISKAFRGTAQAAEDLDKLGKTAAQLNIDVSSLDALQFAAERSGVAVDKVGASLFTLQKRTGEAAAGIGAAKFAFEQLGIDAAQFSELGVEEQIRSLASAIASIDSEEQQAAISSALFGKGNAQDFLKLLQQGGDGIADLIAKGKELRNITSDQTDLAARFEDAWTNAGRSVRGAFDGLFTGFQRAFVAGAEAIGVLDKPTESLADQLAAATAELERLQNASSRSNANASEIREQVREIERLTRELEEQTKDQAEAERQTEQLAAARRQAERAEEVYREGLEDTTRAIKNQTSSAKRLLDQQTAELRSARAEQQSIEEEFAQLRDEVTAPEAEDITGLDVQTKALEARRKLAEGDAEGAIKAARQGADLLRDLKAEGDEAGFVLGFLADQLAKVANEAAKAQTDQEVLDVAREAEKFNVLTAKLNQLQGDAATAGTQIGKAVVAAIDAELRAANFGSAIQSGLSGYRETLQREIEGSAPK